MPINYHKRIRNESIDNDIYIDDTSNILHENENEIELISRPRSASLDKSIQFSNTNLTMMVSTDITQNICSKQYLIELMLHVLYHITLLSMLEPLFFFYYVVSIEEQLLYDQIDNIIENENLVITYEEAEYIKSQNIYYLILKHLTNEPIFVDSFFNNIQNDAMDQKELREEDNITLQIKSVYCCGILIITTILYTCVYKYFIKKTKIFIKINNRTFIFINGYRVL